MISYFVFFAYVQIKKRGKKLKIKENKIKEKENGIEPMLWT